MNDGGFDFSWKSEGFPTWLVQKGREGRGRTGRAQVTSVAALVMTCQSTPGPLSPLHTDSRAMVKRRKSPQ
ncbi:hypothetical protein HPP92_009308 [Vanilla planifolia]|uniref:Uncharacterized protein n=1 Tax=Vanilla planifolia TaxID=51239 RepID=A0A835V2R0_VANPL|nr:hypothetical protein HPP92_009308 [Vanilla planifolia]